MTSRAAKHHRHSCPLFSPPLTHQEDVGDGVQDDQDNFGILGRQQTEKRLEHIGLNEEDHLLDRAATGEVGEGPHHLFLSFVVTLEGAGEGEGGGDK